MERETIIYRGKKYNRLPNSPRRQARVYYWRHDSYQSPFPLHRQIWIDNFGEIPKGFIIHHKDDNPLNNELSNLELMGKSEHSRMHCSRPEVVRLAIRNLKKARKGAKLWHASDEAKKWKEKRNPKGQFIKKI